METNTCTLKQAKTEKSNSFSEEMGLPKKVLFGDEWIELDESMFTAGLCLECKELGYCKMKDSSKLNDHFNFSS